MSGQQTISKTPPPPPPKLSHKNLSFTTFDDQIVKFHLTTTPTGLKLGEMYIEKFPSLSKKSARKIEVLSRTKHRIDAANHSPIKLPPRRYSHVQLEAIREFCKAHSGTIIRKSASPWVAPLHVTRRKHLPNQSKPYGKSV
ncbi:Bgt-20307 [Blumeria graminis f. sp. tritici]|uniref:Bgt-20307 n=2 Tax=Blumeria graminis f. sp. tritici TaxID=62690 RepID=A0A9X9MMU4_BLUGR|nr:Bgt-20307 [Blumeria graminis f. sp. tritici]